MIPAALFGFSLGTAIAWWAFLRQHSTAAYKVWPGEEVWYYPDPLDEVQPPDPWVEDQARVKALTDYFLSTSTVGHGRTFQIDCE